MKKYIMGRLLISILILAGICIFVFGLIQLSPGNPYIDSMKPGMSPEQIETMLRQKGYYDTLLIKFLKWSASVVSMDLGYSMKYGRPVISLILERLPDTLFLTVSALAIGLYFSIVIGRYVAYNEGSFSRFIYVLSGIGISIPAFLTATLLIKIFAFDIPVFPVSGKGSLASGETMLGLLSARIYYGILPISVLSFMQFSQFVRYIKGYMETVRHAEYIRTYQGFGMERYKAYKKIGFRNILPKVFTMIFTEIPGLLSGALITETVFVWSGLGRLNYEAVLYRDYPLIMGIIIVTAMTVLISNFLSDILNYYLDKRIGI